MGLTDFCIFHIMEEVWERKTHTGTSDVGVCSVRFTYRSARAASICPWLSGGICRSRHAPIIRIRTSLWLDLYLSSRNFISFFSSQITFFWNSNFASPINIKFAGTQVIGLSVSERHLLSHDWLESQTNG